MKGLHPFSLRKFKYVAIPEDYAEFLMFCEEYDITPLGEQSARRGWVDWAGTYLRTAEILRRENG